MKIVQYIPNLGTGGAETLVKDYAINLCKNHEVIILTKYKLDSNMILYKQILDAGIVVYSMQEIFPFQKKIFKKAFNLIKKIKWFGDFMSSNQVDVIHTHLHMNIFLYLNRKKIRNIKLFHTIHSDVSVYFGKRPIDKFEKFCTKVLVKKSNMHIITLHDEMRSQINKNFKCDNSIILNNGIDLERFDRKRYNENDHRAYLEFDANDFIIGHVGRLTIAKNHKFLIEIFVKVLDKKPNAKLLLIGTGELKKYVVDQIKELNIQDKVTILENRIDIPELMSIMDVFVFPSIYEGLPVTLVEAQSMGLKCIVSDGVSNSAHLTENYIYLNLNESIDKWCDAILTDEIQTQPYGSLKDFNIKEVAKKLEWYYINT